MMQVTGIISIEAAQQRHDDDKARRYMMEAAQIQADKARRLYPVVISEALQMDDTVEALAILEQLAGIASTLHTLANRHKNRR